METLNYDQFRDKLIDSLSHSGLRVTAEEAVYLNSVSRGCDIIIYLKLNGADTWAKVGFEWNAMNQVLFEQVEQGGVDDNLLDAIDPDANLVMMHCEFHISFDALAITIEIVRDVATSIQQYGALYFGDEGGVVAEVFLTRTTAKLDSLRYEVNTTAPMVTSESWWQQWGDMIHCMLVRLAELHLRLENEFGPSRN